MTARKHNLTLFILFLIIGCTNGQDSLTVLNDSWVNLRTQLQRRNDIALGLISGLSNLDSLDKASVEKIRSDVSAINRFIGTTKVLDSFTVQLVKQKAQESMQIISKAMNLRMADSSFSTNDFRNLQTEMEAAENRIHLAKTNFNKLCNQYKRMDLLFGKR